jgi:hypothetical protein
MAPPDKVPLTSIVSVFVGLVLRVIVIVRLLAVLEPAIVPCCPQT